MVWILSSKKSKKLQKIQIILGSTCNIQRCMMYLFSRGKYIIIQLGGGPPPEETDDEVEYSIQMPMNPTPRGGLFWLPPTILPSVGPSIVVS